MLIGYARVSTLDQTLALQQDALTQAGCERIFTDTASGSRTDRTGLEEALHFLRDGEDTLVVWRLDQLGRSLRHLIDTVGTLSLFHPHVCPGHRRCPVRLEESGTRRPSRSASSGPDPTSSFIGSASALEARLKKAL